MKSHLAGGLKMCVFAAAVFFVAEMVRGTVSAVGHAIFGITLGWAYGAFACEPALRMPHD